MSVKKKCNVVMLSSNEKSNVNWKSIAQYPNIMGDDVKCFELGSILYNKKFVLKLQIQNRTSQIGIRPNTIKQHLYMTSDDEIEVGDWFISIPRGTIHKCTFIFGFNLIDNNWEGREGVEINRSDCKKIIATTDKSLKLPEPSEHFIKKYVEEYNKGNVITDVMVEYEEYTETTYSLGIDSSRYICKPEANSANQITISKVKDSWTREEVADKIRQFFCEVGEIWEEYECEQWIEENL